MEITDLKSIDKKPLIQLINAFFESSLDVQLVPTSTSDGFDLYSVSRMRETLEADKVAAIASILCSISNASAEQISNDIFNIATVESEKGNILFYGHNF